MEETKLTIEDRNYYSGIVESEELKDMYNTTVTASRLIKKSIDFCKVRGYKTIEEELNVAYDICMKSIKEIEVKAVKHKKDLDMMFQAKQESNKNVVENIEKDNKIVGV